MESLNDLVTLENGWSTTLVESIASFIPNLALAIIVWVVAWFIAKMIKLGVHFVLKKMKLDEFSERLRIEEFLRNANFKGGFSLIIASIVFWLIYLFGINIAFNILGLDVISNLISDLIAYIPNLFVAVLIVLVGTFVAKFMKDLTDGATATAKIKSKWLGQIVYVIIMLFVIVTALKQAQVDISVLAENINTIVMGIMLAV